MRNKTGLEYARSKYHEFTVHTDTTLLEFLLTAFDGMSRNKAKDILAGHGVTVDRRQTTRYDEPLHPGQVVRVTKHKGGTQLQNRYVNIVYEDMDLIVVEKAVGILSMAATAKQYSVKEVLDDYFARRHFKCTAHVVHRLDRETSGLMVYAKNIEMAQILEDNWHDIVYDRRYVAVLDGVVEREGGTIESWLKDNRAYVTYSSPTDPGGGKYAVTHYHRLRTTDRFSLVEFKLETGRKNQIRVHSQLIGHPILGDRKYGYLPTPEAPQPPLLPDPVGRLCLHAYRLHFYHPRTGQSLQFDSPIPREFNRLVPPHQTPSDSQDTR